MVIAGRHPYPVVRLGLKPSRGRQPLFGRFDSCCLPPVKPSRGFPDSLENAHKPLIPRGFVGNNVLAPSRFFPHNFVRRHNRYPDDVMGQ